MLHIALLTSAALLDPSATAKDQPSASEATAPGTPASETAEPQDHQQPNGEVVITGTRARATADVLGGTVVVAGEELTRELRPTIGETLDSQPGVSATSFGPNASRPVLRGFTGDRARLLIDGVGSIDVSNTSADHAPVINPLTAERIEILRGPAALLFSPSSIGGVVNVIDSRIPRRMAESPLHAEGIASYGSAAEERSVSGAVDVPVAGKIVVHADGSYTKTRDLSTGGYVLAPALRAEAAASDEAEVQALAGLKGRIPNTAARTWDVAGGAAVIDERGSLGFSVSRYDSLYGVPIRYVVEEHDHEEEGEEHGHGHAEGVQLHARQTRFDVRGDILAETAGIHQIRMRLAAADYRHDEIEDSGEIGTTFYNQGLEGRLELVQETHGRWEGVTGAQFSTRNTRIVGEEKFLPRTESSQYGLFTLQSLDFGALKGEAALRYERSELTAQADDDLGNPRYGRAFDSFSASLGASYALADRLRFGVNLSRSERAPTAEELFSNGPHAGTQAFEIGNPDFTTEKAWGVETTLKGSGDGWSLSAAAYYNRFSDYIFDAPTGEVEDELPVFEYTQADAHYYGFEVQGSARLATLGSFALNADALADFVRATVVDAGPAPRIPPLRLLGGIEAQSGALNARVEVEHSFEQDRVTTFETPTAGFTLVNLSVAWKPLGAGSNTSLTLSANNLFDVEARRHASVLKDYAPLAGRDLRATLRVEL
jgi:iron complex outermembrane receptor protein